MKRLLVAWRQWRRTATVISRETENTDNGGYQAGVARLSLES